MSMFKKAEKSQVKLRIAIIGPAGSGKTLGALLLAKGFSQGGKIAVIDTENGTASLYADRFDFDVAPLSPPYEVQKYIQTLAEASKAGYQTVIVDSLSHAWAGEGGILQKKEQMDARGGDSFRNWAKMTPEQNKLVNAVLHSPTNIICTMRTKTEYAMTSGGEGQKAKVKKMGLAPIQRDGFDYEFDIVFDVDVDTHTAKATKDRTGLFGPDDIMKLDESVGEKLLKWQLAGVELSEPKKADAKIPASPGDHVIKFGANKGRKISDLGTPEQIEKWLSDLDQFAKGTSLAPRIAVEVKDALHAGAAYLDEIQPVQGALDIPEGDIKF